MTRRVDRVHVQGVRQAVERLAGVTDGAEFQEQLRQAMTTEAARLHDALGLAPGLRISFDPRPVPVMVAVNDSPAEHEPRS